MPHVEFLGIPGSGKSTIAARVLTLDHDLIGLDAAVHRALRVGARDPAVRMAARAARSHDGRAWRAAYARSPDRFTALGDFLTAHPDLMAAVGTAQDRRRERDIGAETTMGWIINLMARFQIVGREDLVVIDEGFCQRAVALFGVGFATDDRPLLDAYLATVPTPELLISVQAPLDLCRRRLDAVGWSERLPEHARESFLETAAEVVHHVEETMRPRCQIMTLDGSAPVEDNATAVVDRLEHLG